MSLFLTWLIRFLFFQIPGTRLVVGLLGLLIAVDVFLYIAMALGLYRMAQRQKLPGAFLAWVPVIQIYVIGAIADEVTGGIFYRIVLCLLAAGVIVLAGAAAVLPALGWATFGVTVVLAIFYFRALFRVFALYSRAPTPLLVLSIVFFFLGPVFIFALRNAAPRPVTARARLR